MSACGGEGYVVEPVAARGDYDEGVGVDGEVAERVFGLLWDYDVGFGEALGVGELLAVVGDEQPEAERLCVCGERLGDVAAAAYDQLRGRGVRLDEVLCALVGYDVFVASHRHKATRADRRVAVEAQVSERADGRAVFAHEQLGADGGPAIGRGA